MANHLRLLNASERRYETRRLETLRYTPAQAAFRASTEPWACWRDANQVGKSTCLASEAVDYCRGTHPVQRHRPPVQVLVCSESWEQFDPLMEKIWSLCPRHEIDPRNGYDPGRGITGKPPRLVFVDGPGRGSRISFATYKQSAQRIAGATVHRVLLDEPCPESFLGEVPSRLMKNKGHIRAYFTPTATSAPVAWLKTKCKKGDVAEYNWGLTEEAVWPQGNPAPWMTSQEIDEFERLLLAHEVEMRMGRSWFATLTSAWLRGFSDKNIKAVDLADLEGWRLLVGIDHGTAEGKQAAVLSAVTDEHTDRPRAVFIAEAVAEGLTLPEADARNILDMLASVGLSYSDVDEWTGDRSLDAKKLAIQKSNAILRKELALLLGVPSRQLKKIAVPKKYPGSMTDGMRTLNALFTRVDDDGAPHGIVDERCVELIKGVREFNGHPKHPAKDIVDAARYPIERALGRQRLRVQVARWG